jgi:hypothetical protein
MNSMNSVKLRKITLVSSFHELLAHLAAGCIDAGDTKKRCDPIRIAVLEICPAIQCIDHCPQGAVAMFLSGRG